MATTQSPRDVAPTPLRHWVLKQQAHSLPFLMFLQGKRSEGLTVIMKLCSFTGTEDFYAALLMFAVWIVNGMLGLTIGYVLCIGFCFTNVVKDILRLPRPPPPVVPLERAFDWGFPSHHTLMVTFLSLCMVDTLWKQGLVATSSLPYAIFLAGVWVCCVCFSRLYIGVHSIADLSVGLLTGLALAASYVAVEQSFDRYVVSDAFRSWHIALFALLMFLFYPIARPATTTFLDCMVTIGAMLGCALARNRVGVKLFPSLFAMPASSFANAYSPYICATLRLAIGYSLVMALRQACKKIVPLVLKPLLENIWGSENVMQNVQRFIEKQPSFTHAVASWQLRKEDSEGMSDAARTLLVYMPRIQYLHDAMLRFIVYAVISWCAIEVMPQLFTFLGI